jgi:hypothetical protein
LENRLLKGGIVVGKNTSKNIMILLFSTIMIFSMLAFASAENRVKSQGVVMNIDFKKNTMIVNERTYLWNKSTGFYNDKGTPITIDRFKPQSWVFIEGEKQEKNFLIKEIYLLPKKVDKKERHLYPFMQ